MSTSDKYEPTKPLPTAGYKIDKEKAIALIQGDMPVSQVADEVGCSKANLYELIRRMKSKGALVKNYRDKELDIIDNIRGELLANIDSALGKGMIPEKPSEITSLSLAFCQLTDKSQLLKGKATSHVSVLSYEHSIKELHVMDGNIKELEEELASCDDQGID